MKLPLEFYLHNDVVALAPRLLGKVLCTHIDGAFSAGMIVETEAYCGDNDKACHAFKYKRTARNETMFAQGGVAYIYLCYGIHYLFNVVTNVENKGDAVLIRALEPVEGIETMLQRRKMNKLNTRLTAGPGSLSIAMGIALADDKSSLLGNRIWIEDRNNDILPENIIASTRVGVESAEEAALFPWRFRIKNNDWCSKAK